VGRDLGRSPRPGPNTIDPRDELAGVVSALGYGTAGLSVGQRVFGLTDWTRDGTLAEYVAVEARNLAPLPGDLDFTMAASLPISGLTAWQGLFVHGRVQVGQTVLVHGAAGGVGSMVTQLAREVGAYVIGTGRAAHRRTALDFGAQEFVDVDNDVLEDGRSRLRRDRRRNREAVCGSGSTRRDAGEHHRTARGAARRRHSG
jgi:NADPH:quinone reductase-like Zn-dependent oxidoreductase